MSTSGLRRWTAWSLPSLISFCLILAPGVAPPGRGAASGTDLSTGCTACHQFPADRSHPLGVPAPESAGLPLDGGRVTCTSCHDLETAGAEEHQRGGPQLRLPKTDLCSACHDRMLSRGRRIHAHGTGLGRAHPVAAREGALPSRFLDEQSTHCMGCHDDLSADGGMMRMAGLDGPQGTTGLREHPLGMDYRDSFQRKSWQLRNRAALPTEIELPDGKVGCTSCHSLFSSLPKKLVMSNRDSKLCRSCHTL